MFCLLSFLLYLVGPVWLVDHLVGKEGACCFAFRWFVTCAVHCSLYALSLALIGHSYR